MSRLIYILNGPNLNLLGKRQPEIYGHETLADVEALCAKVAKAEGFDVALFQSNYEGGMVDQIHDAREKACGIVINAGAYTHTSAAIFDALNTFEGPVMECHISNVHKREAFRHHSFISPRAEGVLAGFGIEGYGFCVKRICTLLTKG
ncbi:type II 3-dehydroquinate dehydratase [Thioclava sp. SK-1]|uniref:type II 3-dehydroquinate dehydratase n=1 Tax=Thioclava sp. SK-1 TaxID=1889770 RepID=UPI0008270F41|nr:type II 3-dehydroquinate dehydratase [Thioclava sp. SK-1]OCX65744.1 type II 3-dehydroquinate dehydratase [Thioclava sp. SK-1]